ncbi:hypothetical protein GVO57_14320 (plasmid) [Sphingomonas changnyeongensis]|uniref:Uncharacterized protein n=1 Tax=Sphingomonas changnyeongensis TaxID=2698679 RepID=A0A7Z2S969_9SPHN|nr:hypothetical protein [Sphingomonas changnyeongensis]QHL92056.1 hypothetical protein GVO57_14320 [Sphingomonas changnyeongensis]
MEVASVLAAFGTLAGCAAVTNRLGARPLLGGYKIMDAPSSEVPIGALWLQGQGPAGPGTESTNVITRRSFSSLILNRAARRGLELRFAEYLGLQPGIAAKLSVSVSDISIMSVRDTAALGYQPGEAFLSDAMKASRITITTESKAEAELMAGLSSQGLHVSGKSTIDGHETLTVEGLDLFFAYRVLRLQKDRANRPIGKLLRQPKAPGW